MSADGYIEKIAGACHRWSHLNEKKRTFVMKTFLKANKKPRKQNPILQKSVVRFLTDMQ